MTDQQFFETTDTNLGSLLLTRQVGYRGCYLNVNGLVTFRFVQSDQIKKLVDQFRFDADAPSRSLLRNYHFLIQQVNQAKREARSGGAL
jgi:hypothetical protein